MGEQEFNFTPKGPMLDECDLPRIGSAARRVWEGMLSMQDVLPKDGGVELNALAATLEVPHASVTACVRGFRNDENGGHNVKSWRAKDEKGTYLYRLIPNTPEGAKLARQRAETRKATPPRTFEQGIIHALHKLEKLDSWSRNPAVMRLMDELREDIKSGEAATGV